MSLSVCLRQPLNEEIRRKYFNALLITFRARFQLGICIRQRLEHHEQEAYSHSLARLATSEFVWLLKIIKGSHPNLKSHVETFLLEKKKQGAIGNYKCSGRKFALTASKREISSKTEDGEVMSDDDVSFLIRTFFYEE